MKRIISDFNNYVKRYDLKVKELMGKYHHTFRVMENIKELAKSVNLNEEDIYLSCVIAMYHDIARFKQYTEYSTFTDSESFDHGLVGKKILEDENLLYSFTDIEKNIILNSVLYHNKLEVPYIDDRTNMFIKLVREADQLDIVKEHGIVLNEEYILNQNILKSIYNKEIANRKDKKVKEDELLVMLSWIVCFQFQYSYEFVKENKIIESIFNLLELYGETEETKKLKEFILEEVRKKGIVC